MKDKQLRKNIKALERKIGKSYDADQAPDLMTKWKRLQNHKVWVEEQQRKEEQSAYERSMKIHNAATAILRQICELLNAQGTSGLGTFAVTNDKMEWSIIIQQMGVRNPKTGRIDKRLNPSTKDRLRRENALLRQACDSAHALMNHTRLAGTWTATSAPLERKLCDDILAAKMELLK